MKISIKFCALFIVMITITSLTFSPTHNKNLSKNAVVKVNKVYVCGGKYATKFHSYSKCRGLNNCKGGVYTVSSQTEAKKKGYGYCKICWK